MEERVQAVERASLPLPPPQQARLNELAALPWWTKKYKGVYLTRGGYRASLWHSGRMQHCRSVPTAELAARAIAPDLTHPLLRYRGIARHNRKWRGSLYLRAKRRTVTTNVFPSPTEAAHAFDALSRSHERGAPLNFPRDGEVAFVAGSDPAALRRFRLTRSRELASWLVERGVSTAAEAQAALAAAPTFEEYGFEAGAAAELEARRALQGRSVWTPTSGRSKSAGGGAAGSTSASSSASSGAREGASAGLTVAKPPLASSQQSSATPASESEGPGDTPFSEQDAGDGVDDDCLGGDSSQSRDADGDEALDDNGDGRSAPGDDEGRTPGAESGGITPSDSGLRSASPAAAKGAAPEQREATVDTGGWEAVIGGAAQATAASSSSSFSSSSSSAASAAAAAAAAAARARAAAKPAPVVPPPQAAAVIALPPRTRATRGHFDVDIDRPRQRRARRQERRYTGRTYTGWTLHEGHGELPRPALLAHVGVPSADPAEAAAVAEMELESSEAAAVEAANPPLWHGERGCEWRFRVLRRVQQARIGTPRAMPRTEDPEQPIATPYGTALYGEPGVGEDPELQHWRQAPFQRKSLPPPARMFEHVQEDAELHGAMISRRRTVLRAAGLEVGEDDEDEAEPHLVRAFAGHSAGGVVPAAASKTDLRKYRQTFGEHSEMRRPDVDRLLAGLYFVDKLGSEDSHFGICAGCGCGGSVVMCDTCPCVWHERCSPDLAHTGVPNGTWRCPLCVLFPRHAKRLVAEMREEDGGEPSSPSDFPVPVPRSGGGDQPAAQPASANSGLPVPPSGAQGLAAGPAAGGARGHTPEFTDVSLGIPPGLLAPGQTLPSDAHSIGRCSEVTGGMLVGPMGDWTARLKPLWQCVNTTVITRIGHAPGGSRAPSDSFRYAASRRCSPLPHDLQSRIEAANLLAKRTEFISGASPTSPGAVLSREEAIVEAMHDLPFRGLNPRSARSHRVMLSAGSDSFYLLQVPERVVAARCYDVATVAVFGGIAMTKPGEAPHSPVPGVKVPPLRMWLNFPGRLPEYVAAATLAWRLHKLGAKEWAPTWLASWLRTPSGLLVAAMRAIQKFEKRVGSCEGAPLALATTAQVVAYLRLHGFDAELRRAPPPAWQSAAAAALSDGSTLTSPADIHASWLGQGARDKQSQATAALTVALAGPMPPSMHPASAVIGLPSHLDNATRSLAAAIAGSSAQLGPAMDTPRWLNGDGQEEHDSTAPAGDEARAPSSSASPAGAPAAADLRSPLASQPSSIGSAPWTAPTQPAGKLSTPTTVDICGSVAIVPTSGWPAPGKHGAPRVVNGVLRSAGSRELCSFEAWSEPAAIGSQVATEGPIPLPFRGVESSAMGPSRPGRTHTWLPGSTRDLSAAALAANVAAAQSRVGAVGLGSEAQSMSDVARQLRDLADGKSAKWPAGGGCNVVPLVGSGTVPVGSLPGGSAPVRGSAAAWRRIAALAARERPDCFGPAALASGTGGARSAVSELIGHASSTVVATLHFWARKETKRIAMAARRWAEEGGLVLLSACAFTLLPGQNSGGVPVTEPAGDSGDAMWATGASAKRKAWSLSWDALLPDAASTDDEADDEDEDEDEDADDGDSHDCAGARRGSAPSAGSATAGKAAAGAAASTRSTRLASRNAAEGGAEQTLPPEPAEASAGAAKPRAKAGPFSGAGAAGIMGSSPAAVLSGQAPGLYESAVRTLQGLPLLPPQSAPRQHPLVAGALLPSDDDDLACVAEVLAAACSS
ncbi:hypothetical protein FNF27_00433 [Cafeteria roenbergensis]|uniref:Zinc finger PHD-type domain-containing protein n=4 Tax=Cafeteria roenbergensis TaxID=33653 RepID=A0A5A8EJ35_CAFRO|nr:hypothetical protein FNF27_00433 [Cafeteria roenbergensis]